MNYEKDIAEIVRYTVPGSAAENFAIAEVAADHGEDPKVVARDVAGFREASLRKVRS